MQEFHYKPVTMLLDQTSQYDGLSPTHCNLSIVISHILPESSCASIVKKLFSERERTFPLPKKYM